jgi:putative ubiquitin-RnfH superfamily antitoxin RatB of RatAB toxin-antitoxin module
VNVVVAYAGAEGTALVEVALGEGASVGDAIDASALVERFALLEAALGYAIFGQPAQRDTPLRDGDRVELLRPLIADPKARRRQRAVDRPLPKTAPPGRRRNRPR